MYGGYTLNAIKRNTQQNRLTLKVDFNGKSKFYYEIDKKLNLEDLDEVAACLVECLSVLC